MITRINRCGRDKKRETHLKLYKASLVNGSWYNVEELPFNSNDYSIGHPALSPDGKTLYFVSDMPGGLGATDIYKVTVDGSIYGTPVNLGRSINTEGRETFPFVSDDNRLYFASDGHVGLGGLDLFVSELKDDNAVLNLNETRVGDVFNLGKPINSPFDDFTFITNSATGLGYFASNREGGLGYDDIYSFKSIKPLITKCENL